MRIKNTLVVALLFTLATIQPVFATTNYVLNIRSSADYARIPDSDSLDLVSTSFTLEAWINPSTFTSTDGAIISKRRVDGGSSYHLSISRFGAPSESAHDFRWRDRRRKRGKVLFAIEREFPSVENSPTSLAVLLEGRKSRSADTPRNVVNGKRPLRLKGSQLCFERAIKDVCWFGFFALNLLPQERSRAR